MADFQTVAQQFVEFYYQKFDENRADLAALYRDNSMLSFENAPFSGTAQIVEKLTSLPFAKIQHRVTSLDAQPSNDQGGIKVLVVGALHTDSESRPMNFVQSFQLLKENDNYFVKNDIFRLVYPVE